MCVLQNGRVYRHVRSVVLYDLFFHYGIGLVLYLEYDIEIAIKQCFPRFRVSGVPVIRIKWLTNQLFHMFALISDVNLVKMYREIGYGKNSIMKGGTHLHKLIVQVMQVMRTEQNK